MTVELSSNRLMVMVPEPMLTLPLNVKLRSVFPSISVDRWDGVVDTNSNAPKAVVNVQSPALLPG